MTEASEILPIPAEKTPSKVVTPWLWFAVAVLLFVADRVLKYLALSHKIASTTGPVTFTLFMNKGIAFSLPLSNTIFLPAATVALLIIIMLFARALRHDSRTAVALFIVICGAISNLIDRAHYHATVDYLIFFSRSAVNIADAMIIGGLLVMLFKKRTVEGGQ